MATGFKLSFSFLLPQWENVNSEAEAKLFEGRFQVVGILPGEETFLCAQDRKEFHLGKWLSLAS